MGITVVPSAVTGQTLSAAQWNTQVRDNINGIWVLTTAGDMIYATGASAAARLALTTGGTMIGGASAPEWLALVVNGILKGGATKPEWLTVGAAHTFMKGEGAGPLYGALAYKRQGGHATNWSTAGTTDYTPSKTLIQVGSISVSVSGGNGTAGIGFPTAFSETPIVLATVFNSATKKNIVHVTAVTTTTCNFRVTDIDAESYTVSVWYLAIGA